MENKSLIFVVKRNFSSKCEKDCFREKAKGQNLSIKRLILAIVVTC